MTILLEKDGSYKIKLVNYLDKRKELGKYLSENKNRLILKGQTGSKGIVQGRIRVILDMTEAKKFMKGEILVTGMTRPEFVPLIKKASAIITDEGGITCHAAIISRELKRPCVIGTGKATRFFQNGDLVEVNADKGEIKIIKSIKKL